METSPLLPVVHQKLILCASHFDLLLTEALSSHTPEQRAGMGPLSTPDLSGDPFSCILCIVYPALPTLHNIFDYCQKYGWPNAHGINFHLF